LQFALLTATDHYASMRKPRADPAARHSVKGRNSERAILLLPNDGEASVVWLSWAGNGMS